jgi:integrase
MGEEGNAEFTFHATRHTCGTRMVERGVPLNDMMDQLGYKTASMPPRYIKLSHAARRATILAALQPTLKVV